MQTMMLQKLSVSFACCLKLKQTHFWIHVSWKKYRESSWAFLQKYKLLGNSNNNEKKLTWRQAPLKNFTLRKYLSEHPTAQPCIYTTSEAFPVLKGLCDIYIYLYSIYDIIFRLLQVREIEISLRKWSGGTAHMRTLEGTEVTGMTYFVFSHLLVLLNKVVNFYFYHYFLLKVIQHLTLIEANLLSFLVANEI